MNELFLKLVDKEICSVKSLLFFYICKGGGYLVKN